MIRELLKMNLIERRGDPEKRPERHRPESQPAQVYGQKLFGEPHGTKRKAENQVDDNGNWNKGKFKDSFFFLKILGDTEIGISSIDQ